jgi:hypothetical protein
MFYYIGPMHACRNGLRQWFAVVGGKNANSMSLGIAWHSPRPPLKRIRRPGVQIRINPPIDLCTIHAYKLSKACARDHDRSGRA